MSPFTGLQTDRFMASIGWRGSVPIYKGCRFVNPMVPVIHHGLIDDRNLPVPASGPEIVDTWEIRPSIAQFHHVLGDLAEEALKVHEDWTIEDPDRPAPIRLSVKKQWQRKGSRYILTLRARGIGDADID